MRAARAIRAWFPAARAPATAVEAMAEIKGELPGHRSVEDGSSKGVRLLALKGVIGGGRGACRQERAFGPARVLAAGVQGPSCMGRAVGAA